VASSLGSPHSVLGVRGSAGSEPPSAGSWVDRLPIRGLRDGELVRAVAGGDDGVVVRALPGDVVVRGDEGGVVVRRGTVFGSVGVVVRAWDDGVGVRPAAGGVEGPAAGGVEGVVVRASDVGVVARDVCVRGTNGGRDGGVAARGGVGVRPSLDVGIGCVVRGIAVVLRGGVVGRGVGRSGGSVGVIARDVEAAANGLRGSDTPRNG